MSFHGLIVQFYGDIYIPLYTTVHIYHSLFTHPPTEGHLGCLQVWATMNKATINTSVKVLVWTYIFNSFG